MLRVRGSGSGKPLVPVVGRLLVIDAASLPLQFRTACPLPASHDDTDRRATPASAGNMAQSLSRCRYLQRDDLLVDGHDACSEERQKRE